MFRQMILFLIQFQFYFQFVRLITIQSEVCYRLPINDRWTDLTPPVAVPIKTKTNLHQIKHGRWVSRLKTLLRRFWSIYWSKRPSPGIDFNIGIMKSSEDSAVSSTTACSSICCIVAFVIGFSELRHRLLWRPANEIVIILRFKTQKCECDISGTGVNSLRVKMQFNDLSAGSFFSFHSGTERITRRMKIFKELGGLGPEKKIIK